MLSPEERGCAFFKTLKLYQLNTQQRSIDPVQTANIEALRVTDTRAYPVTPRLISMYKFLTAEDVQRSVRWETIVILIMLNVIRHEINRLRLLRFAMITGSPIFGWRNPLCGKQAAGLSAEEKNILYATHQPLTGKFVPGMPGACQDNINPKKGYSNGTRGVAHSLTLDPREDLPSLLLQVSKAKPAEMIALSFPPISVNVEILNADLSKFGPGDTLVPGRAVIPLFQRSRSRYEPVKRWETLSRINPIDGVRYRSHGFEPEFACTFEKAQSKTLDGAIIDLNSWPGMHLSFEKVMVALTRCKTLEDIRLMPILPGQSLDHLYCLRPDPRMLIWRAGFGPDGLWDPARCKAAMDQLPPDFLRKGKQTKSNKKWKSDRQQGGDAERRYDGKGSSDVGLSGPARQENNTSKRQRNVSPALTATFKLDVAIPATRAKIFKSFHVPPDGDCLFHSFRRLLGLSMAVEELRAQVVEHMETLPPVEQMNIVNEHLIRDPSWLNERHLGPQGFRDANGEEVLGIILLDSSNLVDVHGIRFNRLWQQ